MSRLIPLSILLAPLALSPAPAAAQDAREPAALSALDRMGAALRSHQAVNVHSEVTVEDVLTSGQKLQYGGTIDTMARRPNNLRMSIKMGQTSRELYYDGKTVSVVCVLALAASLARAVGGVF